MLSSVEQEKRSITSEPGISCIWRALQSASLCNGTLPKSALRCFVIVFEADSLSERERCIATRQNKMAAPDVVSARFKKLNVFFFLLFFFVVVVVPGRSAEQKTNR